jgi:hypothetical protein
MAQGVPSLYTDLVPWSLEKFAGQGTWIELLVGPPFTSRDSESLSEYCGMMNQFSLSWPYMGLVSLLHLLMG